MFNNLKARIIENFEVAPGYWQIILKAPAIAKSFSAGQFIQIKCSSNLNPLLPRPFSIYQGDRQKGTVTIVYKIVGQGTQQLATAKKGDFLNVLGPLGRGFELNKNDKKIAIVAGGLGILPFFSLAKKSSAQLEIFWGAATKSHFFCKDDYCLKNVKKFHLATEDGSIGYQGIVTAALKNYLKKNRSLDKILACGPVPMLKKIAQISRQFKIPAQVSLEALMACGFGVCMSCVVETKSGYKKVCEDGPVFEAGEIIWNEK